MLPVRSRPDGPRSGYMAVHIYCHWYCTCCPGDTDISSTQASMHTLLTRSATELENCRIWLLTNSKMLYGVIIMLAIPSFVLGFSVGVEAWVIQVYVSWMKSFVRLTKLA